MKGAIKMVLKELARWLMPLVIISLGLILVRDQGIGAKMAVMVSFSVAYFYASMKNELNKKQK